MSYHGSWRFYTNLPTLALSKLSFSLNIVVAILAAVAVPFATYSLYIRHAASYMVRAMLHC